MLLDQNKAAQLAELVASYAGKPLVWGTNDFVTFARDAAQVLLGRELGGNLKGAYSNRATLDSMLTAAGGLQSILTTFTGVTPVPMAPGLANRGDLLLYKPWQKECLGVAMSDMWAFAFFDDSFKLAPVADAVLVWRI